MSSILDFASEPRPMLCLRLEAVGRLLAGLPPGRFVEVGAGRGDVSAYLLSRGAGGTALDEAPEASAALRARFAGVSALEVRQQDLFTFTPPEPLDLVVVCEVLEHLAEDRAALSCLGSWLCPGGCLVGSVPAFERLWSEADEAVGHLRRYERAGLEEALRQAGLVEARLLSVGFPLGNLLSPARRFVARHRLRAGDDRARRTGRSGVQALFGHAGRRLLPLRWLYAPALALQRWSESRDWGVGWVFVARRPLRPAAAGEPVGG